VLWNVILQFVAGAAGYNIFTFRLAGVLYCLAVTATVQGIDMFRYYSRIKGKINEAPSGVKEEKLKKIKGAQGIFLTILWYIVKVICYTMVTLFVAFITRKIIR